MQPPLRFGPQKYMNTTECGLTRSANTIHPWSRTLQNRCFWQRHSTSEMFKRTSTGTPKIVHSGGAELQLSDNLTPRKAGTSSSRSSSSLWSFRCVRQFWSLLLWSHTPTHPLRKAISGMLSHNTAPEQYFDMSTMGSWSIKLFVKRTLPSSKRWKWWRRHGGKWGWAYSARWMSLRNNTKTCELKSVYQTFLFCRLSSCGRFAAGASIVYAMFRLIWK